MAEEKTNEVKEENSPKKFTIPKGMYVKDQRVFCSKHGEITEAYKPYTFVETEPDGTEKQVGALLCLRCFADWIVAQQKDGTFGKIAIQPILAPIEEQDKADVKKEN